MVKGKTLFWSYKNSGEILNELKSRGFLASSLSTYDFSTNYLRIITKPYHDGNPDKVSKVFITEA